MSTPATAVPGSCNITTFDWTKPHVRDLWLETVINATRTGSVDGVFADHSAQEHIQIGAATNGQHANQLCNGKGAGRRVEHRRAYDGEL